ncbi:hypothetical protein J1N35_028904, partial [Gossypium stocksii]
KISGYYTTSTTGGWWKAQQKTETMSLDNVNRPLQPTNSRLVTEALRRMGNDHFL